MSKAKHTTTPWRIGYLYREPLRFQPMYLLYDHAQVGPFHGGVYLTRGAARKRQGHVFRMLRHPLSGKWEWVQIRSSTDIYCKDLAAVVALRLQGHNIGEIPKWTT